MDVDVFEKKLKAQNLGLLLAPAEKDVKEGRTKVVSKNKKDIPGITHLFCLLTHSDEI
jgi:hypothetical protein